MNTENRYQVTASLYMLREIKHRQLQVNRGYQLLKRKAEALRLKGRQAAAELAATQAVLGHILREAYISLAAVKFTNGESNAMVLENVGEAQVRVHRILENVSGVSTVSLYAIEDPTASDSLRYAGLGAGGHRTGEAKKAFREAIRILIKFASLRNSCLLLDQAIKSTLRKVFGIEKVILPRLHNTENYILTEMDEQEREEFHRLKMVKAKKMRIRPKLPLMPTNESRETLSSADDLNYAADVSLYPGVQGVGGTIRQDLWKTIMPIHIYEMSSTHTGSSGDMIPSVLPHNWDDEDLLF